MNKPHKHAALIKAWADGAVIQFKDGLGKWNNCTPKPAWDPCAEYRIKPEPVVVQYRRYLCQSLTITTIIVRTHNKNNITSICDVETTPGFVSWIDNDWVEHIIEQ